MFKKVKNRNHVLSQPVHKHIKKHTTQKMVLNHPYRVCLLYATNKNSHKFMCEVWFKWWRVRDSNPWMLAWKASELTVSPTRHITNCLYSITNNIRLRQALFAFFANFSLFPGDRFSKPLFFGAKDSENWEKPGTCSRFSEAHPI